MGRESKPESCLIKQKDPNETIGGEKKKVGKTDDDMKSCL